MMIKVTSHIDSVEVNVAGNFSEIEVDKDLKVVSIDERNKGIHLITNRRDVSVVALSEEDTSADLFLVLPPVYLPYQYVYYAVSVERNASQSRLHSAILIVGTENETFVTLNLTAEVNISTESDIIGSGVSVKHISVNLDEMDTLYVTSLESLTGSKVVSNKPITFISGHECGNIPTGLPFCDHMIEQIPPTATWGKEYFTVPLKSREDFDVFIILASEDDTVVTRVCSPGTTHSVFNITNAGGFVSMNISSEQYCSFTSNKPVLLVQFAVASDVDKVDADPFMMIIPPFEQYRSEYLISTFEPRHGRDLAYFVNVIVKANNRSDLNLILLNGSPVNESWSDIFCDVESSPCAYGVQLDISISNTSQVLSDDGSGLSFSATVYAFGLRIGQGYPAAFNQRPVACKLSRRY